MAPQDPRSANATVIETGEFYCSRCKSRQDYALKTSRADQPGWFARLFGDRDTERFVECMNCGTTAVPAVIELAAESSDADYLKGIRRVAIQMMAVDGQIDDSEVDAIQEMYHQITGLDLDDASIRREAERYAGYGLDDMSEFLAGLGSGMSMKGKELILKTAFWVVGADSAFDESEAAFIYRVGGALGVSAADVRVLMDRLG